MLSIDVTTGKRFTDDELVTYAKLNSLGLPTCAVAGAASTAQIGDGAVTRVKTDFSDTATALAMAYADVERLQLLTMIRDVTTLAYGAVVDLNFGSNVGGLRKVTLAGNIQFTTTNLNAGRDDVYVWVIGDGSDRTLTFPAGWKWVNGFVPAKLGANKTALLRLTSLGVADADVKAEWRVEPMALTSTLAYGATTTVDFSEVVSGSQTLTLAGNVIFATSNLSAGRVKVVRVVGDGSARALTFPAGWKWVGDMTAPDVSPSTLQANETALLVLWSWGSADADVVAEWRVTADSAATVAYGTYAPTVSGTNLDSSSAVASSFFYTRIGNVVHVSGLVLCNVTTTVPADTTLTITLPIASTNASANALSGCCNLRRTASNAVAAAQIKGATSGGVLVNATATFLAPNSDDFEGSVQFSYALS